MVRPYLGPIAAPALALLLAGGCAAPPENSTQAADRATDAPGVAAERPLAYVNGGPVTLASLRRPLLEAAGGQALSEAVLDAMLEQRLAERGLALTPGMIEAEKALLVGSLQPSDEDEATRLLREIRRRRGLGEQRFDALLRRNAAMRALVRDRVEVPPAAIDRAYQMAYGDKYRARVITVPTAQTAARLREAILAGRTTFEDAAVDESTDPSSVQGGLLPLISPADPSTPAPLRDALARLDREGGGVSDPIALGGGFALVKLERKVAPEAVELADVRDGLAEEVRRGAERVLMQGLARELLAGANVVVLDPALDASWQTQRDALLGQ